jgi:AcrR family transcriptional regulator
MQAVAAEKLTPERRRQLTRDALLDAATEVFVRRGFEGASLDEIAETAGFTRGAIYKNFEGKEDLFLAVFDRYNERVLSVFADVLEEEGDDAVLDAHRSAQMLGRLMGDPDLLTLEREFQLYEVRHPEVREKSASQRRRTVELVAAFIEEHAATSGLRLKLPARTAAGILLATSVGFAHTSQVDAGQIDLYETFLELIIPAIFDTVE